MVRRYSACSDQSPLVTRRRSHNSPLALSIALEVPSLRTSLSSRQFTARSWWIICTRRVLLVCCDLVWRVSFVAIRWLSKACLGADVDCGVRRIGSPSDRLVRLQRPCRRGDQRCRDLPQMPRDEPRVAMVALMELLPSPVMTSPGHRRVATRCAGLQILRHIDAHSYVRRRTGRCNRPENSSVLKGVISFCRPVIARSYFIELLSASTEKMRSRRVGVTRGITRRG